MVKTGKLFAYMLFFIVALIYFTPKVSSYYLLEQQLKPHHIVVSNESVKDSGFGLIVEDADLSFRSIESAHIAHTDINIFALYNTVSLKDITLSTLYRSFIPLHVESAEISYSIFNPLSIEASSRGDFGEAVSTFDILDRKLHVELKPSKVMLKEYKNTLLKMKKTENGGYSYEKTL